MSKSIAYIFPGQGSQFVGMGKDFYENFDAAKEVYDFANKILNRDIKSLCFSSDSDMLKQTVNSQPCIVATEIAILETLKKECNIIPCAVAGHSLGEYSAYYAAGVLNLKNTFLTIQKRATEMNKISEGKMVAVIDRNIDKAVEIIDKIDGVSVANYNSPQQIVITGDDNSIDIAVDKLKDMKRIVPLAVSGAFHSPLMKKASLNFANFIQNIEINDANIFVYTNVDGEPEKQSENFKLKMPKQIYSSVMWTQTIQNMIINGIDTFIEIGPGTVLSGLVRKINQDVKVYNINSIETLKMVAEKLKMEKLCQK